MINCVNYINEYVIMNVIFVSSRNREREQENIPRTVQITVSSELIMDLLAQGAILQVQPCTTEARIGKTYSQTREQHQATYYR